MSENLKHHRSASNVWAHPRRRHADRWVVAAAAGACFAAGLSRRTPTGFWLAVAGGALAWWAAAGIGDGSVRRASLHRFRPAPARRDDLVDEASRESFPASDAPAIGTAEAPERAAPPARPGPAPPAWADPQPDPGRSVPTDPAPPPEPRR